MKISPAFYTLEAISNLIPSSKEELITFILAHSTGVIWNSDKIKLKKLREKKSYNLRQVKQIQNTIYKLKKQGAVSFDKNNRPFLTAIGLVKLKSLGRKQVLNLAKNEFRKEKLAKDKFCIVLFDIKEKDRYLRNWLRDVLKNLGYKTLQQSVMVGKTKIPQELIIEFDKNNILKNIHIFTVIKSESGTLENDMLVDYINLR